MTDTLSDAPSLILATHLIDQAVFTEPDQEAAFPLFISYLPDDGVPDDAAAIYDAVGVKDGRLMSSGKSVFHHGLQVRIRALLHPDAWTKVKDVQVVLDAINQTTVLIGGSSGNQYLLWAAAQTTPPLFIGVEDGTKRRPQFTINFLVTLEET